MPHRVLQLATAVSIVTFIAIVFTIVIPEVEKTAGLGYSEDCVVDSASVAQGSPPPGSLFFSDEDTIAYPKRPQNYYVKLTVSFVADGSDGRQQIGFAVDESYSEPLRVPRDEPYTHSRASKHARTAPTGKRTSCWYNRTTYASGRSWVYLSIHRAPTAPVAYFLSLGVCTLLVLRTTIDSEWLSAWSRSRRYTETQLNAIALGYLAVCVWPLVAYAIPTLVWRTQKYAAAEAFVVIVSGVGIVHSGMLFYGHCRDATAAADPGSPTDTADDSNPPRPRGGASRHQRRVYCSHRGHIRYGRRRRASISPPRVGRRPTQGHTPKPRRDVVVELYRHGTIVDVSSGTVSPHSGHGRVPPPKSAPVQDDMDELPEPLNTARRQALEDAPSESDPCCVCLDRPRTLELSCAHKLCNVCGAEEAGLEVCPLCRTAIRWRRLRQSRPT